ncbi:YceD family protein [Levilactobacillus bambusae]|uniref:DNA-binding protein n=1 Tax=Levilactobacillus bambusae TaxID=2024736 RepID=A0A2V1N664_9LACO|nr:YceD family protein [Levilactobacillus bambusae]PWG01020.1 DNA-binding protein [Levilactobacillus bambusae]
MKWSLSDSLKNQEPLQFDDTLDLKSDLMDRYPSEVLDLTPVHVSGTLRNEGGQVVLTAHITTTITVPSSRSLEPVALPEDFEIKEYYVNTQAALTQFEESDVVLVIEDDIIDFDKAVGDNILAQVPIHILTDKEEQGAPMPNGEDWRVISEADQEQEKKDNQSVDPRLAKLKNYFPDQDDK